MTYCPNSAVACFFLACLGGVTPWAALASSLKPDEQVVLYPALGRPVAGGWEIAVHGLVYEPDGRRWTAALMREILGLDEKSLTAEERSTFRQRIDYFLVDNERRKTFTVLAGDQPFRFGRSAANGHFNLRWGWPTNNTLFASWCGTASNGVARLLLPLAQTNRGPLALDIHFLSETGLSVISDIDDTIKISEVRDRDALLRNTFCRPFRSVPGMAARYRQWQAQDAAQFHYVTASPWQLYLPLAQFAQANHFPAGTFHMKEFRLKDRSALSLFSAPENYKRHVIEPLLQQFPRRAFVFIGDSGEKDPEIYGELARRHPQQVRRIFIRNVTNEDADAARFRQAFRDVPRQVWQIFNEPSELPERLSPVG